MITKEIIKSEIDKVPEERLEELYEAVKFYSRTKRESSGKTLLLRLRKIKIEGPEDFSCNFRS